MSFSLLYNLNGLDFLFARFLNTFLSFIVIATVIWQ